MGKYFGTDGFRGEANVVLTVEHAFKVGRYLGWYFGREKKARIVIGKDTRRSSYMFEYALASGLTASGADAYLLHVTTTPSVSYVVRTEDFDCGIMISASHNPFYDNGIKVINGQGHKIEAEVDGPILKIAICNMSDSTHIVDKYLKHLQDLFGSEIKVVTSGNIWIDFIAPGSNKGTALQNLMDLFQVKPEECVAFGDQYNDIEMLQLAGTSYAMSNAAPGISYYSTYVTDSVEDVLEDILAQVR